MQNNSNKFKSPLWAHQRKKNLIERRIDGFSQNKMFLIKIIFEKARKVFLRFFNETKIVDLVSLNAGGFSLKYTKLLTKEYALKKNYWTIYI